MKMFDTAYLRLTGWYVAIIMTISLLFSGWVYTQARQELQFGLNHIVQVGPGQRMPVPVEGFRAFIDDRLDDSRARLLLRLAVLNTAVFFVGAAASFFLARRTMQPIEESVEAQHRFTADASHELRTPLAAMKTEIEVGLRDKKLTKEDAVSLLQSNLEEIDRLGNLAEGLLALTQTQAPIALVPIALEDAADRVVKRMHILATAKQITVQTQLQPVRVAANDEVVEKLLCILLDNAIKYSPEQTTITVTTHHKDGHGYVAVQDQGAGIKASELPHIFERFYRADASRSKAHVPGHGLGLSIAQTLAESVHGVVQVSSIPGTGSTFTLKLPLAT